MDNENISQLQYHNLTAQLGAMNRILHQYATLRSPFRGYGGEFGTQYDGDRDIYGALGYKTDLCFEDYENMYERHPYASAVINRTVDAAFRGGFEIMQGKKDEDTPLQTEYKELDKRLDLLNVYTETDICSLLGRYGGILLGFNDISKPEDYAKPVNKRKKDLQLLYVRSLDERHMEIKKLNDRAGDDRYMLPETYQITLGEPEKVDSKNNTSGRAYEVGRNIIVHHERIIHVCYRPRGSRIYGTPFLRSIYNNLDDLLKVMGGSGEMFWRGARPGLQGITDPGYTFDVADEKAIQEKVEEFEHNLKRIFINEGIELKPLEAQLGDPVPTTEVQLQAISAATGIPKRILTGSEMGELASVEDRDNWFEFVWGRRINQVEKRMIMPVIERLIMFNILPIVEDPYAIVWGDLASLNEKQKVEIGRIRSEALRNYSTSMMGVEIIQPDLFAREFLNLPEEVVDYIKQNINGPIQEEIEEMRELQKEMGQASEQNASSGSDNANSM